MKSIKPQYFLFVALFIGILTPSLFTDGMFMDGSIYAVISRNLAEGNGTFWNLYFSDTVFPVFREHPPLALYLGSLGFHIFGDNIFPERFYSLLTGLLAAFLIILIQKRFIKNKINNYIILTLFIWLSFSLVRWTYANNLLENTMTVFVLLSAFFILTSFKRSRVLMLFISGVFLFAAFLSKGFPALFIWSIIFFYWLVYKEISFVRVIIDTFLLILFTVLPLIVISQLSEDATESLLRYFNKQVIGNIKIVKTVNSRFYIIGAMLNEMIIPFIVVVALIIFAKIKRIKISIDKQDIKNSLFFFLISLSGILPIMISMKQRSFYIVPALPFLALSISYLMKNIIYTFPSIIKFFNNKFWVPLSYGLFGISIVMIFVFSGKPGRDFDKLSDVYIITEEIPENEHVTICNKMNSDWSLHAYMQRYGKISLTVKDSNRYFISENYCLSDTSKSYEDVGLNLKKYTLYKRKNK